MTRWATILLGALIALYGTPVGAQMACGSHASMMAQLDMKYGEVRRGWGLAGPTAIFEMWASDVPPYSWTILKVYPSGWACVVAVGDGWEANPPVAPGDPA